jgi:uncharacterized coiled-coil protein SlyX
MHFRPRVVYMPTNRVEELEATVAELESTVRGLTEELVETKERVRILESHLDADPQDVVGDVEPNVDLGDTESAAQTNARGGVPESETSQTEIVTPGDDAANVDADSEHAAIQEQDGSDGEPNVTREAGPEDVAEATKAATEDAVDTPKSDEGEGGDDAEESELGDDIIVA